MPRYPPGSAGRPTRHPRRHEIERRTLQAESGATTRPSPRLEPDTIGSRGDRTRQRPTIDSSRRTPSAVHSNRPTADTRPARRRREDSRSRSRGGALTTQTKRLSLWRPSRARSRRIDEVSPLSLSSRSVVGLSARSGIWYLVSGILHKPNRLSDCQWV